jgi:hypothetical protein
MAKAHDLRQVNAKIAREVSPLVTLYKGDGYLYLVLDDVEHNVYETRSVYTNALGNLPLETWVEEAKALMETVTR